MLNFTVAVTVTWEDPFVRSNGFDFLPHGEDGAAVTKKLEQKCRKPVLPAGEIGFSGVWC